MSTSNVGMLKRMLLLFWAVWLTLVTTTNALDGLKVLGALPRDWPLASGNYQAIVEATRRYKPDAWVNGLLFFGVIAWELLAAALFWRAMWLHGKRHGEGARIAAFTVSLGLWAAFIIAEEVLIAYPLEAVHFRLMTAQLATLLVLALVPDEPRDSA